MMTLICAMGFSLFLCFLLIPIARVLAARVGLVDQPDGHRKIHKKVTPVSGGLAVLVAAVTTVAAVFFLPNPFQDKPNPLQEKLAEHGMELLGLLLGCVAICAIGVADDFGKLRGRHKLLGQIAAIGIVLAFGGWVKTVHIFGYYIPLEWAGFPLTIFLMLGAINSLNLLDGMDGLLGSVGVILSLALAAMAMLAGHAWAAVIAVALAALMGFLRYNLPPATVFLGDSGSMLVGLVLGTLAVQCSLKAPTTIALATPIALLILPILDTAAAIIRRKLTGRSIYTTDRGHLHHCLLRSGYTPSGVLLLIALLCLASCAGVLASQAFENEWIAVLTALSIIAMLVLTRLFGHAETMLIKERLIALLAPSGNARHMEVRLQGSVAWKDLWQNLKLLAVELNLQQLLLDVNAPALHEGYHARWDLGQALGEESRLWHVEVPVTAHGVAVGRLVMAGKPDEQPVWTKIAMIMKVVDEFARPIPGLYAQEAARVRRLAGEPALPADAAESTLAAPAL